MSAPTLATGTQTLLTNPVVAAVLGLALGVALLLVSRSAARLITPDDPAIGMAKVLVANGFVMIVAVASLTLCYFFARPALTWFGIALVAGFLLAASVELFRFGSPRTAGARRR